ncbi:MAG: hypothetical protein AAGA29_07220 [Planctomycetota bacterium]
MSDLQHLVHGFLEAYEIYRRDRAAVWAHMTSMEEFKAHPDGDELRRQESRDLSVAIGQENASAPVFRSACERLASVLGRQDLAEPLFRAARLTETGSILSHNIALIIEPVLPAIRATVSASPSGGKSGKVVNWTKPVFPSHAAGACGLNDYRTELHPDARIVHEQINPPKGRKYRYDLDAIAEYYGDNAADSLRPDAE